MKEDILGYAVDALSADRCMDRVFSLLVEPAPDRGGCRWLACLNPHSYTVALEDAEFSRALGDADWLIPDGAGVVLASRILGGHIRTRVTGSDAFACLQERMNAHGGLSVFFLGGTEETLAGIRARMAQDYPAIQVAGKIGRAHV